MTKLIFQHDGDYTVGIQGEEATLEIDLEYFEPDVKAEIIEEFRKLIQDLWDFKTFVNEVEK